MIAFTIGNLPVDMHTNGHAATLDEAKAQFEAAWRQWLECRQTLNVPFRSKI